VPEAGENNRRMPCVKWKGNDKFHLSSILWKEYGMSVDERSPHTQPHGEHPDSPGEGVILKEKWRYVGREHQNVAQKSKSALEYIQENFFWFSSVAVVFASFLGVVNLWGFSRFIGRPDVFIPSLEFEPGLALLMISYLVIDIFLVVLFLPTSLLFYCLLRCFKAGQDSMGGIAYWLFVMVGMSAAALMLLSPYLSGGNLLSSKWGIFVVVFILLCVSWVFVSRYGSQVRWLKCKGGGVCRYDALFVPGVILSVFVVGVAIPNFLVSILYVLLFYGSGEDLAGAHFVLLLLSMMSLLPVAMFYSRAGSGKASQIKYGVIGFLLFHVGLIVSVSGMFGGTSEMSMRLIGVSDQEVRRYIVDGDQYPMSSLDVDRWMAEASGETHYSVTAISFYAYGAINLLCPKDLADLLKPMSKKNQISERVDNLDDLYGSMQESNQKSKEILKPEDDGRERRVQACIPFRVDAVRKLGLIETQTNSADASMDCECGRNEPGD